MDYDYDSLKHYDNIQDVLSDLIKKTDTKTAPWFVIDEKHRKDRVYKTLSSFCDNIKNIVDNGMIDNQKKLSYNDVIQSEKKVDITNIKFEKKINKEEYDKELKTLRSELNHLFNRAKDRDKKVILCFEGPDASGKGGSIQRITSCLNPRLYKIIPISGPTEEELSHHYLWRFWNKLSSQKLLTIFDRSWYGRVLVERIEELTPEHLWLQGYSEINQFEKQLNNAENIVIKILLYISKDEQLERFEDRNDIEYKQWKITDEDWRNRNKWDDYDTAFSDMLSMTDTKHAPWFVIATNNKRRARISVMHAIKQVLEQQLLEE